MNIHIMCVVADMIVSRIGFTVIIMSSSAIITITIITSTTASIIAIMYIMCIMYIMY